MTRAAARTNTKSTGGGGGGTVNDGVLQIQDGVPIDATVREVTDQIGNLSGIRISSGSVEVSSILGVGAGATIGYALTTTNILSNQIHVGGSASLYLSGYNTNKIGAFFPSGGAFEATTGGVPRLQVFESNVLVNNSLGFGVDGSNIFVGATSDASTFLNNGTFFRFVSGANAAAAVASYTFVTGDRLYSTAPTTGKIASVINIPSHTFGISNTASNDINYRGISLAYTINNTAASIGMATGMRLDATLTNLNGMVSRGFYYGILGSGVSSNTEYIGAEYENTLSATNNNQQFSPFVIFRGNGWKTNATAGSQPAVIRIGLTPVQGTSNVRPTFVIQGSANNGVFSTYASFGLDNFNQVVFSTTAITSVGITNIGSISSNSTNGGNAGTVFYAQGAARTISSGSFFVFHSDIGHAPTSGTATFSAFVYNGTINQTGGANGITRGLWINPTLTSAADFRAIDVEQGRVFLKNLRTTAGSPGELWNDGGTIKIS